jgi:hypothetical protein
MSSNNNINVNTNNEWTTVKGGWNKDRSGKLIANSRSNSPNYPVTTDSPINCEFSSSPTFSDNFPVTPIKPIEPVNSVLPAVLPALPYMSAFTHTRTNNWENALEQLEIQYGLIKHSIKLLKNELTYPLELRGKTPEEKEHIISTTVYNIVVDHLAKIKQVLLNCNKWVDTINPRKITGMLLENKTLKEKYILSTKKEEICKLVMEGCYVLYYASKSNTDLNISGIINTSKTHPLFF